MLKNFGQAIQSVPNWVVLFFNNCWVNKYYICLMFLQLLSFATTLDGIKSVTGSSFIALFGSVTVQLLFTGSWHELTNAEKNDGRRKSHVALIIVGVACLIISGFFSSIGFFKATKQESSEMVSTKNHNISELEKAKSTFSVIQQQIQKNFDTEIEAKNNLIQEKTNESKNLTSKSARKSIGQEIENIKTEIETTKKLKSEVATANYSSEIQKVDTSSSIEVANAIEQIKVTTQNLIALGKVELTPEWLEGLSYQQPKFTDVEGSFFQKLEEREWSVLIVCLIGFGIDFGSILALFCNRRARVTVDFINDSRNWLKRIVNALLNKPNLPAGENAPVPVENEEPAPQPVKENFQVPLEIKDYQSKKVHKFHLNVEAKTESALNDLLPKVKKALLKRKVKVNSLKLPRNWRSCLNRNKPIIIKVGFNSPKQATQPSATLGMEVPE